ncbi:MAG TPA: alpha/beta hydrolase [Rhizomicrobium sp.]
MRLRRPFELLATLFATLLLAAATAAQPSDDASSIIAHARRIVTPHGIDRLEKVRIGGIDQWVSIRGADTRNPVLLYVHGGPGYVSMPMNWWFARTWEDYFTVVQWDQRGAGKTYLLNDPAKIAPTMTINRMEDDTEEMVNWLRHTLGKKKIFVLGHSAGSYLGLMLAKKHPDWLHAYIGVGQITDAREGERRGWRVTMAAAQRAGNAQAIRDLKSVAPYFSPGHTNTLKELYTERKWLDYFGGVMANRHGNDDESDLSKLSPDYTQEERAHIWDGNAFSERYMLMDMMNGDLSQMRRFDCPIIVFAGRYDINVNSDVAAEWFAKAQAPAKQFVWFEHSAHLPMTEEPGKFLMSLVRVARPFAEQTGDVAPDR